LYIYIRILNYNILLTTNKFNLKIKKLMDAFIGEIRAFSFGYVPERWLACDGTSIPMAQYQLLYAVINNNYGVNKPQTPNLFYLPDLRGLVPVGSQYGTDIGIVTGTETISLNSNQMPIHNHNIKATTVRAKTDAPLGTNVPGPVDFLSNPFALNPDGSIGNIQSYSVTDPPTNILNNNTISTSGKGIPHENRMPYLPIIYCICYDGEFPVRE
jgi:microcystin-dependent protein